MNKTTKTLGLIVFAFFISQNLYSQLFINKIDNKDIEIVKRLIPTKGCGSIMYDYIRINRSQSKETIFNRLMKRIVEGSPISQSQLVCS